MFQGINTLAEWAKLVSTSIHIPYLASVTFVIWLWWPQFKRDMLGLLRGDKLKSYQCMVVGVALGFIAKDIDGGYWQTTWIFDFYRTTIGSVMVNHGSVSNIPCRALLGFVAAYFHIEGYRRHMEEHGEKDTRSHYFKPVMIYSCIAGITLFFVFAFTHPDN